MIQIHYNCLILIYANSLNVSFCVKHIKSNADILIVCDIDVPAATL